MMNDSAETNNVTAARVWGMLGLFITFVFLVLWPFLLAGVIMTSAVSYETRGQHKEPLLTFSLWLPALLILAGATYFVLIKRFRSPSLAAALLWCILGVIVVTGVVLLGSSGNQQLDAFATQPHQEMIRAVADGNTEGVRRLAQAGEINFAGKRGVNPLYVAFKTDQLEMFKLLLTLGADPNWVPLNHSYGTYVPAVLLQEAGHKYRVDRVREYLSVLFEANLDPNRMVRGQPLLFYSVRSPALARMLIDRGANPSQLSDEGDTVLMYAVKLGRWESATLFSATAAKNELQKAFDEIRMQEERGLANHQTLKDPRRAQFLHELDLRLQDSH